MSQSIDKKKKEVKESILQIQSILRQRELLTSNLNEYYQILKNLGYPKNIVNLTLKTRQKTRYQLESEKILIDELESMLGD